MFFILSYLAYQIHFGVPNILLSIILLVVLVGNTRKAMTIVLSFILFPKPYNWMYVAGGFLVFGSLVGNALMKERVSRLAGGGGKRDGGLMSGV